MNDVEFASYAHGIIPYAIETNIDEVIAVMEDISKILFQ